MDLYGHLFEGSDRESAERMQRIFGASLSSADQAESDSKLAVMRRKHA
jgi:hypothetical protein